MKAKTKKSTKGTRRNIYLPKKNDKLLVEQAKRNNLSISAWVRFLSAREENVSDANC